MTEMPMAELLRKYGGLKRGDIQSFQSNSRDMSGMMATFCERLFWNDFSILFQRINERLTVCVQEDLLNLM